MVLDQMLEVFSETLHFVGAQFTGLSLVFVVARGQL